MSAQAMTGTQTLDGEIARHETLAVRIYLWSVTVVSVVGLAALLAREWGTARSDVLPAAIWILAVFATDLLAVRLWGAVVLTMSLPILLAAGMDLPPALVGVIAFVGFADPREFKREVSLSTAIYNRCQVAVSCAVAAGVFHALDGRVDEWPRLLLVTAIALVADFVVNALLVAIPLSMITDVSVLMALRNLHGSSPLQHAAGYACLGLLAAFLGLAYSVVGNWALFAFVAPLLLARQMFVNNQRLDAAAIDVATKTQAIATSMERVSEERRDERIVVAGGLHDEVLQALYKVHLMGQVLKHDLDSGRLLDLDKDLPDLIVATDAAQQSARDLIRDLRQSALGPGSLSKTLGLLEQSLQSESSSMIRIESKELVEGSPMTQLIAYQVVREAARNALKHSRAKAISARVWQEGEFVRVVVSDDGCGFDPGAVDQRQHFGLLLMRERVEAGGGSFLVNSEIGAGTVVSAELPIDSQWAR